MKRLSWKPIRRGEIYCSPACGAGCRHAAYLEAFSDARKIMWQLNTKGWKINVWENLGWHWCLTNLRCGISLHTTGSHFWCMVQGGDAKDVTSGSCLIQSSKEYKDPNKAVAEAIKNATRYFEGQVRGFNNLKSILP